MIRVYYHYANGCTYAGHHFRNFPDRTSARNWIRWMNENREGFILDEIL
jgi:hypothetical protein